MSSTDRPPVGRRIPVWGLALVVVAVIAAAPAALAVFGGGTLPERAGPPTEELAIERTVLSPGTIALTVRNTVADPVQVAQVFVNDTHVESTGGTDPIGRLGSRSLVLTYPWSPGQPYLVSPLTSTGTVIEHTIPAAAPTPTLDARFIWIMVLLSTYVGLIPLFLGMLVLPFVRHTRGDRVVRVVLALTVGFLSFLAVDAALEGFALAERSVGAFGGAVLVLLGAGLAFLALTGIDRLLHRHATADEAETSADTAPEAVTPATGSRLALMIAIGVALHNLGEGLAIGSAYAVGELALGIALVVGFAVHNTTEGMAIVAPLTGRRPPLRRLLGLGVLAGTPEILGALIGVAVDNPALSAALLGVGAGAIIQVITQIVPALRDRDGRLLDPAVIGGLAAGVLVLYATGLLVAA